MISGRGGAGARGGRIRPPRRIVPVSSRLLTPLPTFHRDNNYTTMLFVDSRIFSSPVFSLSFPSRLDHI